MKVDETWRVTNKRTDSRGLLGSYALVYRILDTTRRKTPCNVTANGHSLYRVPTVYNLHHSLPLPQHPPPVSSHHIALSCPSLISSVHLFHQVNNAACQDIATPPPRPVETHRTPSTLLRHFLPSPLSPPLASLLASPLASPLSISTNGDPNSIGHQLPHTFAHTTCPSA